MKLLFAAWTEWSGAAGEGRHVGQALLTKHWPIVDCTAGSTIRPGGRVFEGVRLLSSMALEVPEIAILAS